MDPWINADDAFASTVTPELAADIGGVTLRITARVVIRLLTLQHDQDIQPPQLISHLCRRTVSSSEHVTAEHVHFTITHPYHHINHYPTWEEQTRRMFSSVAADHVLPADLDLLARTFRGYTYMVRDQFPIDGLVAVMEFFSVVEFPVTPSASASQLGSSLPGETYEFFFGGGDNVDVAQYTRGPRPASTAAVEGLQTETVTTAEEDRSCSICLDPFDVMIQAMAMPCGHSFHEACLKEWLRRSNSCPLCRFSLPAAE